MASERQELPTGRGNGNDHEPPQWTREEIPDFDDEVAERAPMPVQRRAVQPREEAAPQSDWPAAVDLAAMLSVMLRTSTGMLAISGEQKQTEKEKKTIKKKV